MVCIWYDEFKRVTDRQLPLFYVANEVVNLAKRNDSLIFLDLFDKILPFVCYRIQQVNKYVFKARKTIDVWTARNIFPENSLNLLLKALEGTEVNIATIVTRSIDDPYEILKDVASQKISISNTATNSSRRNSKASLINEDEQNDLALDKEDDKFAEIFERGWQFNSVEGKFCLLI